MFYEIIQVMSVHITEYIHIHSKFVSMSQTFNLYVLFAKVLNTLLCGNKYMDHKSIVIDSGPIENEAGALDNLKLQKVKSVFAKQHSISKFLLLIKLYFIA